MKEWFKNNWLKILVFLVIIAILLIVFNKFWKEIFVISGGVAVALGTLNSNIDKKEDDRKENKEKQQELEKELDNKKEELKENETEATNSSNDVISDWLNKR